MNFVVLPILLGIGFCGYSEYCPFYCKGGDGKNQLKLGSKLKKQRFMFDKVHVTLDFVGLD